MNSDIEPQLRKFIFENLIFADEGFSLTDDESLLAQGAIDSTGIMELVEFVSAHFNLNVPVKDINQENFDSISRLANYIRRRRQQPMTPVSVLPEVAAVSPAAT